MGAGVTRSPADGPTAVLCSGGLDSVVLLAHELEAAFATDGGPTRVRAVYVSSALAWEAAERRRAEQLLAASPFAGRLGPLARLDCPVNDTYPRTHWALRGMPPAYGTADEEVYLVGRNVLLLAKAATWCAVNGIGRLALGLLRGNPFPDATPGFFAAMERALSLGLAHDVRVAAPFRALGKAEVVALGRSLGVPFELTLSCMSPAPAGASAVHCGRCSKCRERLQAFDEAGLTDPAEYAFRPRDVWTGT